MASLQQFWSWLYAEAREMQQKRRALGIGVAGLATGGLAVAGTLLLPGLGTLAGAAIGGAFGSIVAVETHKDKTFDRLRSLSNAEATTLVQAIQNAYTNLTYQLACDCLQDGTVADLLDQIEAQR